MLDSSMRGGCHVYGEVSQFKGRVEQTERWEGVEKNDGRRNSEDRLLGWRTIILKIPKFLQRPTFLSFFFFFSFNHNSSAFFINIAWIITKWYNMTNEMMSHVRWYHVYIYVFVYIYLQYMGSAIHGQISSQ